MMLFITNRYPKQGIETVIDRDFDFDLDEKLGVKDSSIA
jgi:hypothetical protein